MFIQISEADKKMREADMVSKPQVFMSISEYILNDQSCWLNLCQEKYLR